MSSVYLEHRGSTGKVEHSKFYRVVFDGPTAVCTWGATGSKGQSKTYDSATARAKIAEKKSKGYVEITTVESDGTVTKIEDRPSGGCPRGWGLEVETHSNLSPREIASRMQNRGLLVNLAETQYFHSSGSVWDVKRDGSCGYEFASPILSGNAGIFDAKLAVEKIREVCPDAVDDNCGIHVTVGVGDFDTPRKKRFLIAYLRAQDHFYKLCNESRQNNRYCKKNPTHFLPRAVSEFARLGAKDIAAQMGGWERHEHRYHGLNLTNFFKNEKSRAEFRMLESTVEIRKVGAWIRTVVGFVETASKLPPSAQLMTEAEFESCLVF